MGKEKTIPKKKKTENYISRLKANKTFEKRPILVASEEHL
jgi:hypothetical protein